MTTIRLNLIKPGTQETRFVQVGWRYHSLKLPWDQFACGEIWLKRKSFKPYRLLNLFKVNQLNLFGVKKFGSIQISFKVYPY